MKKIIYGILIMLIVTLTYSWTTKDNVKLDDLIILNSVQKVESLNLADEFNLSKEVYNEFLESLIFDDLTSHFRGAKISGINNALNEKQREKFWKYFGLTYKNGDFPQNTNKDLVFMDYKPRFRGCKWDPDWICVIYTDATETK